MTHGVVVLAGGVDLNTPGTYLTWSIFTISAANLAVICVMLLLFVLALVLPFPPGEPQEQPPAENGNGNGGSQHGGNGNGNGNGGNGRHAARRPGAAPTGAQPRSWTGRVRLAGVRWLPPDKLLPETQPSYVASWVYLFGVASLAAFIVAVVSGFLIALGGPDWWRSNPGGHFFNSLHLWSVEFFMAFLVIHLWGKFWMAAWRGKRGRTWITGMLAFLTSIIEAFTGYLSQQNFDSQWIATNGKDAFNAAGIGAIFNVMNFGQMLLWHVVLAPLILFAIIGLHILLVRYRGVVHPFAARRGRDAIGRPIEGRRPRLSQREARRADAADWQGPLRRYDLIREASLATAIVVAATIVLAGILSSPNVNAITIRDWANASPTDFVTTAATELAGTSETATYGPPYNNGTGSVQSLWISWQRLAGVTQPVNAAQDFVINPLTASSGHDPALRSALGTWNSATPEQRAAWASAYVKAAGKLRFGPGGTPVVPPGAYGPVPVLMDRELTLARDGALDAGQISGQPFYGTNFTKPLLFLEDGNYYLNRAHAEHLVGDQWGVMNETGSYPGQPWLWLYQLWYHIPGFDNSPNVDLIAIYLTGLATLLLMFVPFIPGLRDIPRWIPIYRLIWRRYYKDAERPS